MTPDLATEIRTTPFILERFYLNEKFLESYSKRPVPWGFGPFSEVVYYRTYSRTKANGLQERWQDTIQRVVEGVMSIRKDWYKKMGLVWDEKGYWHTVAEELMEAMFTMKMLSPGRGLWAMGTDYIYERGSMSLNNCGAVDVLNDMADAAGWAMNALMCGVGVGFSTQNATFEAASVPDSDSRVFSVPDSREGWVESVKQLIYSYFKTGSKTVEFDYSLIRPKGTPLKGFGGMASGPDPLIKLHERLRIYLNSYAKERVDRTRLIADVMNAIGACVVSGNIRRSAEIAMGSVADDTFLNLKNYDSNPERAEIGWMSNNSVVLSHSSEFELLPMISNNIRFNGEPGVINMINIQKYGRTGKKSWDEANLTNPCGEIPLVNKELCNLSEVFPSRCEGASDIWHAMELGTIYASTVSLLPTQDPETNAVIARNRRIGVSASGIADWIDNTNLSNVTMILREGYEKHVEPVNRQLAKEAGVPHSIRITTVKPSGTISLLAGVSAGMNWPTGGRYCIRRMRISKDSPLVSTLQTAGIPYEDDSYSDNTYCFAFPLDSGNSKTRPVSEVSIWEQASLVAMLQREWADNCVSNTLIFQPEEAKQVERVLAAFAPVIKSISLLPAGDTYAQPPYESITKEAYEELSNDIRPIDWSIFSGWDGEDPIFCNNETCDIPEVPVP